MEKRGEKPARNCGQFRVSVNQSKDKNRGILSNKKRLGRGLKGMVPERELQRGQHQDTPQTFDVTCHCHPRLIELSSSPDCHPSKVPTPKCHQHQHQGR
uniref:Uncharacterized protein n=1 Tax=Oryza rufipogon TaxID=4529 RepID=A0A0E0P719_ORYRU